MTPSLEEAQRFLSLAGNISAAGISLPCEAGSLLKLNPFAVELRYDDQVIPRLTTGEATLIVAQALTWADARVAEIANASR